jgi:HSP20 family protein
MSLPRLWTVSQELDPYRAMRREMENAFRAFDQKPSSPGIGAGAPAVSVAETNEAFEVTAELPGVDEKDINVSLSSRKTEPSKLISTRVCCTLRSRSPPRP